ncbi:MAG: ferrous iron transport protein A [Planctomycetes bacterium]|nr:ferrous iron transport protein A [Planctomycetota bacterium]
MTKPHTHLSEVRAGREVRIVAIPDEEIRSQLIRFGISEGSRVVCEVKLPLGPLVLRHNRQEIAVGRQLAKTIRVS